MQLITTCVNSSAEEIDAMTDHEKAREIDYAKAECLIGREALAKAFPQYDWNPHKPTGLALWEDYHVRYHESVFNGKPCVYVVWSATEFVFV